MSEKKPRVELEVHVDMGWIGLGDSPWRSICPIPSGRTAKKPRPIELGYDFQGHDFVGLHVAYRSIAPA